MKRCLSVYVLALTLILSTWSSPLDANFKTTCRNGFQWIVAKITVPKIPTAFNQEVPLPNAETPLLLIGLFGKGDYLRGNSELDREARSLSSQLNHLVITYMEIPEHGLNNPREPFDQSNVDKKIKYAMLASIERSKGSKIAIVKLDGINPSKIKEEVRWTGAFNATNSEIRMILENPILFRATRWVQNHKELSDDEVKEFFKPYLDGQTPP